MIEVVGTQVMVGAMVLQYVIGDYQNRVAYRDGGLPGPALLSPLLGWVGRSWKAVVSFLGSSILNSYDDMDPSTGRVWEGSRVFRLSP